MAEQFIYFFPDKKTRVVTIANNSHMRTYIKKYKELEYPYFALQIREAALNREGLPARNLYRQGTHAKASSDKSYVTSYKLTPINVGIRVIFATNDITDIYEFIQVWITSANIKDLKFYISPESSDLEIPINVELDESLSIPDLENDEIGEIFLLETQLNISSFTGIIDKKIILKKVKLFNFNEENSIEFSN